MSSATDRRVPPGLCFLIDIDRRALLHDRTNDPDEPTPGSQYCPPLGG